MGVDLSNKINMKMFISEATPCAFEGISLLCKKKKKNRGGILLKLKENQSTRD